MLAGTSVVAFVAALALVALGLVLASLVRGWRGQPPGRVLLYDGGVMVAGWAGWLLVALVFRPPVESALVLPTGGLAGVAAVLVTLGLERRGIRGPWALAFGAFWTIAVFSPVAIALFSVTEGLLGARLRTLDLGGALPVLVAAGASTGAVLLLTGRESGGEGSTSAIRTSVVSFGVVWVLWLVWLVGLELRVDELTPQIVLNGIVAPAASVATWLIVQRVRYARTTPLAGTGGLLTGLTAVTAGCAYLNTVGAALTGAIAGALCSLIGYATARRMGSPEWLLASVLLIGGGTGVVLLGLFATRAGLIFTGQPEVLFSQTASAVLVAVYSALASAVLWWLLRGIRRLFPQARAVG